jgi:hypothetical protein
MKRGSITSKVENWGQASDLAILQMVGPALTPKTRNPFAFAGIEK